MLMPLGLIHLVLLIMVIKSVNGRSATFVDLAMLFYYITLTVLGNVTKVVSYIGPGSCDRRTNTECDPGNIFVNVFCGINM